MKTLVLDRYYQPLRFVSYRKLVLFVVKDKVNVISVWDDVILFRGISYPATVSLKEYARTQPIMPKFNRKAIFRRDDFTCAYSGKRYSPSKLTIDHVIPKSKGGENTWDNCVTASFKMNSLKGDRTPEEAGLKLLIKPCVPKNQIYFEYRGIKNKHPDWEVYFKNVDY